MWFAPAEDKLRVRSAKVGFFPLAAFVARFKSSLLANRLDNTRANRATHLQLFVTAQPPLAQTHGGPFILSPRQLRRLP